MVVQPLVALLTEELPQEVLQDMEVQLQVVPPTEEQLPHHEEEAREALLPEVDMSSNSRNPMEDNNRRQDMEDKFNSNKSPTLLLLLEEVLAMEALLLEDHPMEEPLLEDLLTVVLLPEVLLDTEELLQEVLRNLMEEQLLEVQVDTEDQVCHSMRHLN
jgi:hypothetical protein